MKPEHANEWCDTQTTEEDEGGDVNRYKARHKTDQKEVHCAR